MANKRSGGPRVLRPRGIFKVRIWPVKSAVRAARLQKRNTRLGVDVTLAAAERQIVRAARREGLTLQSGRVDLPRASDARHAARLDELSDAWLAIWAARASVRAVLDGRDDIGLTLEVSDAAFRAGLAFARYEAYRTPQILAMQNLRRGGKQKVTIDEVHTTVATSVNLKDAARKLRVSTKTISRRLRLNR